VLHEWLKALMIFPLIPTVCINFAWNFQLKNKPVVNNPSNLNNFINYFYNRRKNGLSAQNERRREDVARDVGINNFRSSLYNNQRALPDLHYIFAPD